MEETAAAFWAKANAHFESVGITVQRVLTNNGACFDDWLHTYNHHRGDTALAGKSLADLVPNLRGQNS